jgi:U6 snRNA-associated Sm-like protein LSm7
MISVVTEDSSDTVWRVRTDPEDMERVTDKSRKLGLVVVRGTQVSLVSPEEGMDEIANPFVQQAEE